MNSYELSKNYWNWAFDNPEKVSPNHAAIYFFAIEHCNRLGWKEKFGFPSQMTMDAVGIKKHSTYIRYFNDLVDYGFFKLVQKSKNQYSSNIISLNFALPKKGEALGKAISKHGAKQTDTHGQSTGQSKRSINKLRTNKPYNKEQAEEIFQIFQSTKIYFDDDLLPKKNKDFRNWIKTISDLIRIDKVPPEKIIQVTRETRRDDFWAKNFMSITKLRKKNKEGISYFRVYTEQMKSKKNGENLGNHATLGTHRLGKDFDEAM